MRVKSRLTEAQLRQLLRPQLRLFLSADIEGSTRFKQAARGAVQEWLTPLFAFLKDFGEELRTAHGSLAPLAGGRPPTPAPWKILGDELIYQVELRHATEAAYHLEAFMLALRQWNDPRRRGRRFRVKGSGWLAAFPVGNAVLPLAGDPGDELEVDFLGPALDIGFRLRRFASPRELALSVELAWLLLTCKVRFRFFYHGRHDLRGIMEGIGYPVLTIDVGRSSLQNLEGKLAGRKPCRPGVLRQFCEEFIREHGQPPGVPYLPHDPLLGSAPEDYEQAREEAESGLRRVFLVVDPAEPEGVDDSAREVRRQELLQNLSRLQQDARSGSPPSRKTGGKRGARPRGDTSPGP